MSGNPSPFIPPLGTPRTPASAAQLPPAGWPGPNAGQYPAFGQHLSPYPPFVPGGFTPGPSVNHYFPGTNPPAPHAPLPGVSLDYTGYPSFGPQSSPWAAASSHTPAAPPPVGLSGGGWAGPGADSAGAPNWGRRPAGGGAGGGAFPPPPVFPPPPLTGGGGPAYPGIGHPMMGQAPPHWPQPHNAFTPAPFPADLWGGTPNWPQPGAFPGAFPGGGGGGGGFGGGGGGFGGGAAFGGGGAGFGGGPGFGPPPLARASESHGDRLSPWSPGPNYGPVLPPFLIHVLSAAVQINPLLLPPPDDASRDFLKWNMLFPSSHVQRSSDPPHISWSKGRDEPATFPRVTHIRLVCVSIPYMVDVRSRSPDIGVTCGDVIDAISENLLRLSGEPEFRALPPHKQRQLGDAYRHNRSREHGVPGGRLGDGMRRLDWLAQECIFDGIVANERVVAQICGQVLPCTFELRCTHRFPMTREEIEQHESRVEAMEREEMGRTSRASRGRRSRATTIEEVEDEGR